jgi:hypothetical protein
LQLLEVPMVMLWTPLAFGVTMLLCFTIFFFYCWRMRHSRTHAALTSSSIQVSATIPAAAAADSSQQQQLPKEQFGIQKEVLETFPTVKANELMKLGSMQEEENSQCPICLLEYEESDVLRQLPACGHIFHTSCVDPWLEKQPTCPVCRVLLHLLQSTKASEEPEPSSSEHEHQERSRPSSRASAPQLAASSTPSWVLVNPPLPLPPAAAIPFPPTATAVDSSSSSSTKASSSSSSLSSSRTHDLEAGHFPQASNLSKDSAPGECPQLRDSKTSANWRTSCHQLETVDGWGSGYLKSRLVSDCRSCKSLQDVARNIMSSNNAASSSSSSSASCNIQIKSRGMKNHSVHSRRWLTESFSFVLSDTFGTEDKNPSSLQEPAATTVDQFSNKSATTTTNHQSLYYSSYNRQHSESLRVYESRLNADSQLPLTISPEKCSFEFVPVLTGGCSAMDFSCR